MNAPIAKSIRTFPVRHPIWTGVTGGALLVIGLWLIGQHLFDRPPDAEKGDLRTAAAFVSSESFTSLSSTARAAYLRQLGARYLKESTDNKRLLDKALGAGASRPLQRELGLAMVRSLLGEYDTLTPEKRRSRIQGLRLFASAMNFTSGTAAALDPKKNPLSGALASEDAFKKGLGHFQRDLLLGMSGEERAKLRQLAKDVRGR